MTNLRREMAGMKCFHITTKGIDRSLFKTPADFQRALNIIALRAVKYGISVYAYCLMSNHVHCAVRAPSFRVARLFFNYFKQGYSRYYNQVYHEPNVFYSVPVTINELKSDGDLRRCIAYILRNPVEARICGNADQYPWSSYACYFESRTDAGYAASSVAKRRVKKELKTHIDISLSNYSVSESYDILPESVVDSARVEQLFGGSREELAKAIAINPYYAMELEYANPVKMSLPLHALLEAASARAKEKYGRTLSSLSMSERGAMVVMLRTDFHASPYEIAQVLSLPRKNVEQILGIK